MNFAHRAFLYIWLFFGLLLTPAYAADKVRVTFATDWKAQAEQGGFYQAKALGLYAQAGLDVKIISGGPQVNIPQLLGAGAIDFGMGSNAFIPLNMIRAGIPARAVMASFQKDPQVLITHPRDDIKTLVAMRDKPIMIADATISSFWVWLKATQGFRDTQIRKYTFNLAPFLVDKRAIQQGYVTSEPYTIQKQAGFTPQVFLLSDYGYPGYAAMVLAHNRLIEARPEIVQAFVTASIAGWQAYMQDPAPGNRLIMQANPDMRPDALAFAHNELRTRNILGDKIGMMQEARWQDFFDLMAAHGVYDKTLNWRAAFTTRFLND